MTTAHDPVATAGLQIFGRILASISHEIKNVLAVIRESTGLMEDLLAMHRKGMPLDVEKLATLAERVRRQTWRADVIVKDMNRFAHSVDEPMEVVEVGELICLMAALGQRPASMKGVSLSAEAPETPVTVLTNRFMLELAVWTGLEFAMAHAGHEKSLVLSAKTSGPEAVILIDGLQEGLEPADSGPNAEVLAALDARLGITRTLEGRTLILRLKHHSR